MRAVLAKIAHQIPDRPPLKLAVGERVTVSNRDREWPEFVFVTCAQASRWVPARHLSSASGADLSSASGAATVWTAYDTTELPTQAGDLLCVAAEDLISGWLWCRAPDGREERVPINTVEAVD